MIKLTCLMKMNKTTFGRLDYTLIIINLNDKKNN